MSVRPFFEDEESVVALPFKDEMPFYICKFRTVRDFLDWAENEKDLSLPCMLFYAKDQMLDAYESNDLVMVAFADKDMLQDFIDKMEDNSAKVITIY